MPSDERFQIALLGQLLERTVEVTGPARLVADADAEARIPFPDDLAVDVHQEQPGQVEAVDLVVGEGQADAALTDLVDAQVAGPLVVGEVTLGVVVVERREDRDQREPLVRVLLLELAHPAIDRHQVVLLDAPQDDQVQLGSLFVEETRELVADPTPRFGHRGLVAEVAAADRAGLATLQRKLLEAQAALDGGARVAGGARQIAHVAEARLAGRGDQAEAAAQDAGIAEVLGRGVLPVDPDVDAAADDVDAQVVPLGRGRLAALDLAADR